MYVFKFSFWQLNLVYLGYCPFHGNDQSQFERSITGSNIKFPNFIDNEVTKAFILHLLDRDPLSRLGMNSSPHGDIRKNKYFENINWLKLQYCEIEPTFRPKVKSATDLSNFDKDLTTGKPKLSHMDKKLQKTIDNNIFRGFSFTSKNIWI